MLGYIIKSSANIPVDLIICTKTNAAFAEIRNNASMGKPGSQNIWLKQILFQLFLFTVIELAERAHFVIL